MARNARVVEVSSSSDESDEDIPEASICQERINHFVTVTDRDEALAQMYLQQNGWDTERALNVFFRENGGGPKKPTTKDWVDSAISRTRGGSAQPTFQVRPITAPIEISISDDDDDDKQTPEDDDSVQIVEINDDDADDTPPAKRKRSSSGSNADSDVLELPSSSSTEVNVEASKDDEERTWEFLRFMSWNIDGLDDKNVKARAVCVAKHLLDLKIDVAFLQEVTPENFAILKAALGQNYLVIPARPPSDGLLHHGDTRDYFTTFCIRKCPKIEFKENLWRPFPGSIMKRGLQIAKLVVKKRGGLSEFPMAVVNAHLESTKDHATERKVQLKKAFTVVEDLCRNNAVCVFSGDLNARDGEIVEVGGLPKIARDMWEACGQKEYLRYTWDARRNTNCGFHNPKTGPRLRFDRAYFAQRDRVVEPEHFGLQGILKVPGHQCYPSDHWALYYVLKRVPGGVNGN